MKTFFIYETREDRISELKLEEVVTISVENELELINTVNSKKFKLTLPFNLLSETCIVTEVPPEELVIERCLPYKTKYFELVSWEIDSIKWEIYQ